MIDNIKEYIFIWVWIGFLVILAISAIIADLANWENWVAYLLTAIITTIYFFVLWRISKG